MLAPCILLVLATAAPPAAPTPPPTATTTPTTTAALPAALAGRWQLNLAQSDNLDPLLDRLGGGFIEKQAAKSLSPVHVITPVPGGATIHVTSTFQDKTDRLVFDGKTPVVGEAIAKSSRTTHLISDGAIVSTTAIGDGADGFVIITTRRRVGAQLVMTLEVQDTTRGPLIMRRVFDAVP